MLSLFAWVSSNLSYQSTGITDTYAGPGWERVLPLQPPSAQHCTVAMIQPKVACRIWGKEPTMAAAS
jgi:hypothetical protein